MSFSKRGTMLLIATRMSACAFKRFLNLERKQNSRRRVLYRSISCH